MNQKNIDYNDNQNQKAYRKYYREQSQKEKKFRKYLFLIPLLIFISLFSAYIIQGQLQYTLHILFIVGCLVSMGVIVYFVKRSSDLYIIPTILFFIAGFLILYLLLLDSIIQIDIAIVSFYSLVILFPIFLGIIYHIIERKSSDCANDVVQYITPRIDENHTAVILEHNANRAADGGDLNALPLIKVLKKYEENFQIYLCLNEDDMVKVLTNPHAKRFWIFGHGERGGFRLTDKFFSYEEFMREHGTELHDIDTIEYVYQCHCNPGSAKPLTDCLLNERKGKLDPNVDNMPNYFDSGLADMELDDSLKTIRLTIYHLFCKYIGKLPYVDLNYNCPSSVEHIINRYEAHLENKRELAGKETKNLKKTYLEYYRGQLINAVISGIYLILIPLLIISPQITALIIHGELLLPPNIVLLIGGVFSLSVFLYWIKTRLSKVFFSLIAPCYVALFILLVTSVFLPIHSYDGLSLYGIMITISIILGATDFIREVNSWRYAKKVTSYMNPHIPEDHTAIILTHDTKRAMDGGDKPVLTLLEALTKYNEDFQVYLCLYEKDMVDVLTNPYVKRIWIFGHGDRGGCCLTGKYFSYEDFMTEKTDGAEKLRDIESKEYVYQCHCNPKSTTPLTDYLLKEKGLLNPNVDDMPNYCDSGIADMKVDFSQKKRGLSIMVRAHKILGYILHMDFNYTNPSSIEYFINRYAEHLEKKSKLPKNETNDQSNSE